MKWCLVAGALFLMITAKSQKTDAKLADALRQSIAGFHGDVGIYVKDLKRNRIAEINGDSIFPTASVVKIPILIGINQKIERGELLYHGRQTYTDSLFYDEGDDIVACFKPGSTIELSKLMMLMITISDNCASLWLQGLSGGGLEINKLMDAQGLKVTRVNSRTPGREAARAAYGWGQTSPREIGILMEKIVNKQVISEEASQRMLRILSRQYWDEEALSSVPGGVFTADKTGALDETRNEVLYVNGKRPYILAIFTKNNQDKSWEANNEAWVLTRKISALLWNYFN